VTHVFFFASWSRRDCSALPRFRLKPIRLQGICEFFNGRQRRSASHISRALTNRVNNDPEERDQMGLAEIEMCRKGPVPVFRSLTLLPALGSR
jgi:hypothetical protein